MTDAREIEGFCTDCGNWTNLHGPIGDRRCRCGSGRVAVPPAGYVVLSEAEMNAIRDGALEEAAEVGKEAAKVGDCHHVAAAIRGLGRKA